MVHDGDDAMVSKQLNFHVFLLGHGWSRVDFHGPVTLDRLGSATVDNSARWMKKRKP